MAYQIDPARQTQIWGEEGQQLIEKSSLLVVGADLLGREIVKSASILKVGTIYFMDDRWAASEQPFLDIEFQKGESIVQKTSKNIMEHLNPDTQVIPIHDIADKYYLDNLCSSVDFIIDTSNNPVSQKACMAFADRKGIPMLNIGANRIGGIIGYHNPDEPYEGSCIIDGFENQRQGIIISNIFSGMGVEEFRKNLFVKNRDVFADVYGENKKEPYITTVDQEILMVHNEMYSTIGKDRLADPRNIDEFRFDDDFPLESALVCGGGAIGNYVTDMLARMGIQKIDFVDFDKYDGTNLNRQPLAYDMLNKLKAEVLAMRTKNISEILATQNTNVRNKGKKRVVTESRAIYGMVAESLSVEDQKKGMELLNEDWFDKNKYDLIFGCFDNLQARVLMNQYALKFGFKYLDGGSSVRRGTAATIVPGKSNCLNCSINIQYALEKEINENLQLSGGCRHAPGSINMSNQTTSGLLIVEARKVMDQTFGNLVEYVKYYANKVDRLQPSIFPYTCKCK